MNTNSLSKLDFDKIISEVLKHCSTYLGQNMARQLQPSNNKEVVKELLNETTEAVNLIIRNSTPSFCEISDITIPLKLLETNGTLSAKFLLDLATIFKLSRDLKDYFNKDFLKASDFPILAPLFSILYTNKNIINTISSSIIDENTIDDSASVNLKSIRKKQVKLEQDIRTKLNEMIHSSSYSKYIQENIITLRNGRFVIPVKEEYRSQIKGFIHDISNAGSTVFIEPLAVFEMNNLLNELKMEEELEIEKILKNLSMLFLPYINELKVDLETIGKLDFIFAKAKYSRAIKGVTPIIYDEKIIYLKNARHPFIDSNKVVPITLELGKNYSSLLITGPNTGRKNCYIKNCWFTYLYGL